MVREKKHIILTIGIILLFIGSLLPSMTIATENISFIKENGMIILILMAVMAILLRLEKKEIILVPAILSFALIIKFIIDNKSNLERITNIYHCKAEFKFGIIIMILGNIIILLTLLLTKLNTEKIKMLIETTKEKIKTKKEEKQKITPRIIEKLQKKENKNKITKETTSDGKIAFNKIVINVDKNLKENKSIKEKIKNILFKLRIRKITKKNLSVAKYKEEKIKKTKTKEQKTYYIQTIDIKRWTRSSISCINCGAKVNANSEYCFLCDCKIKLNEKEKHLS